MGLFSKNKEEMPLPPMPPAPEVNNSSNEDKLVPPSMDTNSLSAPPIPGGSLEEIKSQVSLSSNSTNNLSKNIQEEEKELSPNVEESKEIEMPGDNMSIENSDDDSLFDFSELDLDDESPSISEEKVGTEPSTNLDDLKFIKQNKTTKKEFETFFITTKQFKSLLEIVDSVKKRVKDASETHLRLMDIKAEEDIEYENLRKDFEFIEDKLYQVDNIIFEK